MLVSREANKEAGCRIDDGKRSRDLIKEFGPTGSCFKKIFGRN